MATRTNGKSPSPFDRIRERLRSALVTGGETTTDDAVVDEEEEPTEASVASGNLFQCSTCGTVYIAAEKHVCSNCDVPVEKVQATLRSAANRPSRND
ncbi:hypothetical protein [Natronorubrum thiooxidans]|uniref:Small CPxCG-related zinc finger protein n=1 Tax=Natronorubrum thiooxidans TaxID=308853 RepID=A0A1N7DXE3_9EURY|nr:hypothetical protein [Natronorubrum thiooxidans]SIR80504.1 hypothetical protein SAMN05421752_10310 [Natronorubrum thiooxidans]